MRTPYGILKRCSQYPSAMQLIIAARRGRRVLHLVNLRQQAAGLSTYPRNVGRLTSIVNSGATARQNGYGLNTVKQCGAAFSRKSFATASTSATDDSTPKRRGRPAKSNTTKTTKPKTRKSGTKKKAKKAKPARVLTEAELEKKRELREAKKVKETIKELVAMSLKKEEPKLKSALPWNLFVSEKLKGANSFGQDNALTNIAVEYRNLPESEREVCFGPLCSFVSARVKKKNHLTDAELSSDRPSIGKQADYPKRTSGK